MVRHLAIYQATVRKVLLHTPYVTHRPCLPGPTLCRELKSGSLLMRGVLVFTPASCASRRHPRDGEGCRLCCLGATQRMRHTLAGALPRAVLPPWLRARFLPGGASNTPPQRISTHVDGVDRPQILGQHLAKLERGARHRGGGAQDGLVACGTARDGRRQARVGGGRRGLRLGRGLVQAGGHRERCKTAGTSRVRLWAPTAAVLRLRLRQPSINRQRIYANSSLLRRGPAQLRWCNLAMQAVLNMCACMADASLRRQ